MKIRKLMTLITLTALLGASSIIAYADDSTICEDGTHQPDLEGDWFEAQYTECGGGYKDDRFFCSVCGTLVNREGEKSGYTEGTGVHVPNLDKPMKANYAPCTGGYKEDYYICKFEPCGTEINAQGEPVEYYGPEDGAMHTMEHVEKVEPTVETEGCKEHWKCTVCGRLFADEAGQQRVWDYELVIEKIDETAEPEDKPVVEDPAGKPSEDKAESEEVDAVKTGDSVNMIGYITVMTAALAVAVGVVLKRRSA